MEKKIVLMNCSIVTIDGCYIVKSISLAKARELVQSADMIESAVGHESTAEIISELLGINCRVNRIKYQQQTGEIALVFQLKSRPPEGKILSREEVETIGYEFRTIQLFEKIEFGYEFVANYAAWEAHCYDPGTLTAGPGGVSHTES